MKSGITFLISILILIITPVRASDYYWVGGSGDWSDINHWVTSSGGNIHHIQTPTSNDNVFFDANSMSSAATINLNSQTIFCRDFNVESINSPLAFQGICQLWKIYGGMKLSNNFSFNVAHIYFEALSGTHIIKTNGKSIISEISFKGVANWEFQDNIICGNINFESGTLDTKSNSIFGMTFTSNSNQPRSFIIGNSDISFLSWTVSGSLYNVNSGSSHIEIRQSGASFTHSNINDQNYYNLEFKANGYLESGNTITSFHNVYFKFDGGIIGSNKFDSLVFAKSGIYTISPNTTQIINQGMYAEGVCDEMTMITSNNGYTTLQQSSGSVSCDYIILHHIHAAGGANFVANAGVDLGDNIGWQILPAQNRDLYWVGDSGAWDNSMHWSLVSGGPGGECIPTSVDNVFFDNNSFIDASLQNDVVLNTTAECHDFRWQSNVDGNLLIKYNLDIYGSSFFGNAMVFATSANIRYLSDDLGETIETSNIDLNSQAIRFIGKGSWQLLDSLNNGSGKVYHLDGHLKTLGKYVRCGEFASSGFVYRELSLGNSVIDVESEVYFNQDSLSVYPNTSHIRMVGQNAVFKTEGGPPITLYNVTFMPNDGRGEMINGITYFNKLEYFQDMYFNGDAISNTVIFHKGQDYKFDSRSDTIQSALIAVGNCYEPITMRDKMALDNFYFHMTTGSSVSVNNVNMRGCNITGAVPYTAVNSSDLGMNIGWTFNYNSIDHFWVGGQGNWQDSSHWSYSSGGVGGACIPVIYDDVYFDGNSFVSFNDTVRVDSSSIFCRDMDWNNATNTPVFVDQTGFSHFISGSLTLNQNMFFNDSVETFFVWSQNNKTINISDKYFANRVYFCDTGQWTLLDTFFVNNEIIHSKGSLIANQNLIRAKRYIAVGSYPKVLDITNSEVHIIRQLMGSFVWNQNINTQLISTGSHIKFFGQGSLVSQGSGQTIFNNVSFLDSTSRSEVKHSNNLSNTFNYLKFKGDGDIYGENTMDTLEFTKSNEYRFETGFDQYIVNKWIANADCYGEISITGKALTSGSGNSTIHKANGNVLLHSIRLKNIEAVGAVSFTIYNGYDLGGNSSNWTITPTTSRTLYWVNESGDWYDTTHWSLSSGGLGGECIPTYKDDVFFDTASFHSSGSYALSNMAIECHDLIWRWTPIDPEMQFQKLNIYGSVALGDTMTSQPGHYSMFASDTGNYIKTSGHFLEDLTFVSDGGWYLIDSLRVGNIIHKQGSFNTKGFYVSTKSYKSITTNNRSINFGGSKIDLTNYLNLNSNGLIFNSLNSTISFNQKSISGKKELRVDGSNSLYFHNVEFLPVNSMASIVKNNTGQKLFFDKLVINNDAEIYGMNFMDSLIFRAGNTYELEYAKTQFIGDYWFVRGNNCHALNLQSTKKNNTAYVNKVSGSVTGDFINMRDISAVGGATFYAGLYSTDISNNSAWLFSNGPQYVYGLGPDTSFALGGNITLSAINFNGGPNTTYLWSNGSTNSSISVNKTGWYYITVDFSGGCVVVDSIYVGCRLEMDYNIIDNPCFGDSLGTIQALVPDPNYQYKYQWITGDTLDFIDSLPAGAYSVYVSADSGLCTIIDTVLVNEPPEVFSPQSDTAFCVYDSVLLDLGNFVSFVWSDNYTGQYRWINQADTFVISVQDADGCWSSPDTISIREDQKPIIYLGNDTTICLNESVLLDAGAGYDDYLWSTNSKFSQIKVYYTGVYWVKVREKTCVVRDTIELFNCPPKFIVPNVFTPNGDGINDVFNIDYQNIWEFEIRIYDRWGVKVYQSKNLQNPWDGRINGRESSEGVYFWEIIYQEYNGVGGGYEDKSVRGTVTIFR